MRALARATRVEVLKLRRTLALRLALLVPLLMLALAAWSDSLGLTMGRRPDAWATLTEGALFFWWGLFVLPPFVALLAALLADVDHRGGHWTRLFALPAPRWSVYAAKLAVGVGLLGLGSLLLAAGECVVGLALGALQPDLGLSRAVPWREVFGQAGAVFLASWLVLALELWVAVRWRGLTVPCGLGLLGTVVGLVLGLSPRTPQWARIFPWSMGLIAGTHTDQHQLVAVVVGLVGGVCLGAAGCWDASQRDVV